MGLNYERLMTWQFDIIEKSYSMDDCILYALGVGFGCDPFDRRQLRYTYEPQLEAVPTMSVVLGRLSLIPVLSVAGADWKQILHGEQSLTLHKPLNSTGCIRSQSRIDAVIDKGPGRGALVCVSREVRDAATDQLISTESATLLCRADGGFGGPAGPIRSPHEIPERQPDAAVELPTTPQTALLYRLSGDKNPLHVDPDIAAEAGFPNPILHGLCTFGVAGHALLRELCDYDPARLRRLDVRFTQPAFPGETIRTLIWVESDGRAGFRCVAVERGVVVLDCGYCEYQAAPDSAPG